MHNGYQVTNSAGNLVDLDGNQINGAFLTNHPGLPGLQPDGVADAGLHGRHAGGRHPGDLRLHLRRARQEDRSDGVHVAETTRSARETPATAAALKSYDNAFETFFQRLAADGITPQNTLFVISAEENDQFAGANVGRATQPTPAGCDGVNVPCNYATGQIGELAANIKGLLSTTASAGTQYTSTPRAPRSTSTASRAPTTRRSGNWSATPPR